jgi:hypothetical protein
MFDSMTDKWFGTAYKLFIVKSKPKPAIKRYVFCILFQWRLFFLPLLFVVKKQKLS